MNRGAGFLIVGLLVAIGAVVYILVTGFDAPAAIESGIESVREMVTADAPADTAEGEEPADPAATATPPARAAAPPAAAAPTRATPAATTDEAAPPVAASPDLPDSPAGPPLSAPSGRPPLNRAAHFLPGNYPTWTEFGVQVTEPMVVRAGGVVSVEAVVSGPGGVSLPAPAGGPPAAGTTQLVLPSAPYLALLGRVCSDSRCSDPFLIGSDTTLCPSTLQMTGELQLLTNNYVRVAGRQTSSRYSTATGGFAFYTEPASGAACTGAATSPALPQDAVVLAAGEVLRRPEFTLSSGLTFWKPFFLPLGGPILIRAAGRIESTSGRPASGPEGVVVPEDRRWWARTGPATSLAQRQGRLFVESLPYNALIGRLCGADGCGAPFLVGAERVVCPVAPFTDRIELWLNRVISTPSMLDNQTPLTYEMFDVQTQRGQYQFEVEAAPRGACGTSR